MIMAANMHSITSIFSLFLLMVHFFSPSSALFPSRPTSSDVICNATPHPNFCRNALPHNKSTTIYDCGRLSIRRSLSTTKTLLSFINGYLSKSGLSKSTIFALQDCQVLLGLNVDFLSDAADAIKSSNSIQSSQSYDKETLLSSTITNVQTCLDGLQATPDSKIAGEISPSLTNGSMSCSVSLALFKNGWVSDKPRGRLLDERDFPFSDLINGRKFLPVNGWSRPGGNNIHGRKLLQIIPGGVSVTKMVVVNPDGSGNYTTINDAIAAAPNNTKTGQGYYVIYVVAGVYEEYVSIASNKKYLMMIGDGINQTIITGNRNVVDGWTTFNSATFVVTGQGFVAANITIRNTAGAVKHQAVALRSGADLSAFYSCSFEGYQDTLYTHSMRQFYKNCDIYGTVDFIFGNAAVVLQSCNIYPRLPMQGQFNAITAQGRTDINQNTGTSIHDCSIRAADDLATSNGTTRTYLGRPWKEYSRTVYMQSFMDSLINPAGWVAWSGDFALSTLYYAEYNNTGPGSDTTSRVTWPGYHVINETDAVNFTVSNFISGEFWLPAAGIPYTAGLL